MVKPSAILGAFFVACTLSARLFAQELPPPAPFTLPPPLDPAVDAQSAEAEMAAAPGLEEAVPPAEGAPTLTLPQAMALALERNFGILGAADVVQSFRIQERVARAQFLPKLLPRYVRAESDSFFGLDVSQKLPYTGGSVTAAAAFHNLDEAVSPFTRTSDVRLVLNQPLLRGFGPNAASYNLRNARRVREGQERLFTLAQERLAVLVATTFYAVLQQRQLLAVSRQSLRRSLSLQRASEARLQVGLVSKLDVFRAELQASQAEDSVVRAESALQGALEQLRFLMGLAPTDAVEPEAAELPEPQAGDVEPLEILQAHALDKRLDLQESRDQVGDAERTASLARQNLLPQLDLGVDVTRLGRAQSFGDAFRAGDRRVNVFFSTSYPLERTGDVANRTLAVLALESRARALRQRELEIQTEVRTAVRELVRIQKSLELQRKGMEVAEQQRRLATLRYQRGLASNFDVVDAEGSLVLARSALVGLLASYQIARIELLRVTGDLDLSREFGLAASGTKAP